MTVRPSSSIQFEFAAGEGEGVLISFEAVTVVRSAAVGWLVTTAALMISLTMASDKSPLTDNMVCKLPDASKISVQARRRSGEFHHGRHGHGGHVIGKGSGVDDKLLFVGIDGQHHDVGGKYLRVGGPVGGRRL
jgi:hypothetical protein